MSDWSDARRILCVRLDTLGDVLMTTPAIRALKESHSDRRITLVTSPSGAALGPHLPEVDEILAWDSPWLKGTPPRLNSAPDRRFCEELRARRFDGAVIFTVFSQNPLPAALFCHLADIPRRLAHCRENPYQLLSDWIPETEPQQGIRHEVQRQLDLVHAIGCTPSHTRLSFQILPDDPARVDDWLDAAGIAPRTAWIVIHPGATAASRRYPIQQYAVVADQLSRQGFRIVITGSAAERELIEDMQTGMRHAAASLAGRLTLGELAALIERAPLLLTNNTGPAHIAAAVGTPVVDLYALTNPQHTPWQVPQRVLFHDVPCKNCFRSICPEGHHDCLRRVRPETVVAAVLELYRDHSSASLDERWPLGGVRNRKRAGGAEDLNPCDLVANPMV